MCVCVGGGGIHDQRQPGCEDKSYPQQRAAQQVLFCFCKYLNNTGFPQIAVQHAQSHHNYDSLVKYLSGAHILKKQPLTLLLMVKHDHCCFHLKRVNGGSEGREGEENTRH